MIARKNPDGTMGYMITDKQHGREWHRYFIGIGLPHKAKALASNMKQDRAYMVPTEWPEDYDPTFSPSQKRFMVDKIPTPEERQANYERFVSLVANIGKSGDLFQTKLKSIKIGERFSVQEWLDEDRKAATVQTRKPYKDD
jgi:hypothetical protein